MSACSPYASAPDQLAAGGAFGTSETSESFPVFLAEGFEGAKISETFFSDKNLTAVCLWTSDCVYCPEQLAALDEAARELEGEGFAVLALLLDGENREAASLAAVRSTRLTLAALSVEFDASALMQTSRVPYTLFVNGEGRIVGEPMIGAHEADECLERALSLLGEPVSGQ